MKYKFGIFFDLDGTLADNEHLKAVAFSRAIEKMGGKSHSSFYKQVMGMSGQAIRKHFADKANISIDDQAYFTLYKSLYEDLIKQDVRLRPGVIPLLKALHDKGIYMAIVSSAYAQSVHYIVDALAIEPYFRYILTGDDLTKKKPDPECYLMALEKSGLNKGEAIVFEDTESGVSAAHAAGIQSLGIRHDYNQHHDLSKTHAEYTCFENDNKRIKQDINAIFHKAIF